MMIDANKAVIEAIEKQATERNPSIRTRGQSNRSEKPDKVKIMNQKKK